MLRDFTNYGLEHWGSDTKGVETTRYFFLNWCSFLCRYVPVGVLERVDVPGGVNNAMFLNQRPPKFVGRVRPLSHIQTHLLQIGKKMIGD
jgi:tRNA-dihydrouridine synthase 3